MSSEKRTFRSRPMVVPAYPTHDEAPTRRGALARLGGVVGALVGALLWSEHGDASSRRPPPPGKPKRRPKPKRPSKPRRGKKKPKKRRPPVYNGFAFTKPAPGDLELERDE